MNPSKEAAYTTLYTVLSTLSKVMAPFVPFMAENIYQNLVRNFDETAPLSVHLCKFPEADEKYIDKGLEKGMTDVLKVVVLGRAARNKANIKNRQPLPRLIYNGKNDLSQDLKELVEDELNVKNVEINDGSADYVTYIVKPQLKTLGPKYGALLGKIRELMNTAEREIVAAVKNGGRFQREIDGKQIDLGEDDVLISVQNKEGFSAESDGETTVVLDTELTQELILEGVERELVSKIQTMRKEAGFEVVDHIEVGYTATGLALSVLEAGDFAKDVLCDKLSTELDGYTMTWDINGEKVTISAKKIEK
jgi:isoleucyl-tRNA synthetase